MQMLRRIISYYKLGDLIITPMSTTSVSSTRLFNCTRRNAKNPINPKAQLNPVKHNKTHWGGLFKKTRVFSTLWVSDLSHNLTYSGLHNDLLS